MQPIPRNPTNEWQIRDARSVIGRLPTCSSPVDQAALPAYCEIGLRKQLISIYQDVGETSSLDVTICCFCISALSIYYLRPIPGKSEWLENNGLEARQLCKFKVAVYETEKTKPIPSLFFHSTSFIAKSIRHDIFSCAVGLISSFHHEHPDG